ncbi:hypothetical protein [Microbacterium maritypicum]|uniref:Uncharacterized protein n=1 Tax=Microbacterium maritypicum TaxID=33918 RepID=A0ACD4B1U3_MICMQ|nr:hypothetical protein [Microbacterium liquefaciens]UTT51516.1 hypothetical protein NMQ05_10455 [Microbacterium liquefaciens]
MQQKPIPGQDALDPPDADVARQYLAAADAVVERRDRAIDRRALAGLQMVNAAVTAGYLVAFALVLRQDDVLASQVILFTFLVWGQLASGMAQRHGMQWRWSASRWPLLLGGGVVLVGAVLVFGFVALDTRLPVGMVLIPAGLVVVGIGGYGAVQLVRAAGDPRPPRPSPLVLPTALRWGTILVGVVLGVLTMLAGAPDGVLRSVITLLVMLALFTWLVVFNTPVGLPAVGASWRGPHVTAFLLAACVPVALVLGGDVLGDRGLAGVVGGAVVMVLVIVASFIPGRASRG